ncbi:hypothetical protein MAM1_0146c06549 [Mucor ambiguus]|uniref:Wax synthase domain-containing protein n=1 Tax=Mucor ambiguus TaxID=91626 RepID=A0A0C9MI78_9FUNG|nr:hypothetical protein MAM1_0146c06549 [Mucor ambiguus]
MRLLQYFETGPTRIPISTSYYLGWIAALLYTQNILASIKPTNMSTNMKRAFATPLLVADLALPVFFMDLSGSWNLLGATIPFMAFLRFLDLFWVAPIVQGKEAYASMKFLQEEFWVCLRKFPKNKEEEKKYVKDRKFYHIIPHFIVHATISDIIGAWFMTFTKEDVMRMYHTQPLLFFGFFCMALVAMSSGFVANGYIMQLVYVLMYEKGSYCKAQWRRLMEFPICATSLGDIWSFRWHQSLKPTWLNLPFTEVRILTERALAKRHIKSAKRLGIMAAALSVFMISGVLHEYLVYVNVGLTSYMSTFTGQEMCFFTIHGIAVMLEKLVAKAFKGQHWVHNPIVILLRRAWALGFACYTFPLFLKGFMEFDSWHAGAFTPYQPKILEIMRQTPGMRRLCGSLF